MYKKLQFDLYSYWGSLYVDGKFSSLYLSFFFPGSLCHYHWSGSLLDNAGGMREWQGGAVVSITSGTWTSLVFLVLWYVLPAMHTWSRKHWTMSRNNEIVWMVLVIKLGDVFFCYLYYLFDMFLGWFFMVGSHDVHYNFEWWCQWYYSMHWSVIFCMHFVTMLSFYILGWSGADSFYCHFIQANRNYRIRCWI